MYYEITIYDASAMLTDKMCSLCHKPYILKPTKNYGGISNSHLS